MCEHCGCRGIEPIAELMDEHLDLLELAGRIRRELAADDRPAAAASVAELGRRLDRHVHREELGVFAALKSQGDFADPVADLEREHLDFEAELAALDPHHPGPEFERAVRRMLGELSAHIDKENLGVFPVAVVTLDSAGWETVARAHAGAQVVSETA
jgi:hemerythrin-like domain-containing protein